MCIRDSKYIGSDFSDVTNQYGDVIGTQENKREKIPFGDPGQGGVGVLNESFHTDKLYFGKKPKGMDSFLYFDSDEVQYGATSHDAIFMNLLKVYSRLDKITNTQQFNIGK